MFLARSGAAVTSQGHCIDPARGNERRAVAGGFGLAVDRVVGETAVRCLGEPGEARLSVCSLELSGDQLYLNVDVMQIVDHGGARLDEEYGAMVRVSARSGKPRGPAYLRMRKRKLRRGFVGDFDTPILRGWRSSDPEVTSNPYVYVCKQGVFTHLATVIDPPTKVTWR